MYCTAMNVTSKLDTAILSVSYLRFGINESQLNILQLNSLHRSSIHLQLVIKKSTYCKT